MKNCYLLTYTITFKNGIRSSSMPRDVIAEDFVHAEQLLRKHLLATDENVASVTVTKSVMTAPNVLVEEVEDRYGAGVVDGYNDGYNAAVEDWKNAVSADSNPVNPEDVVRDTTN